MNTPSSRAIVAAACAALAVGAAVSSAGDTTTDKVTSVLTDGSRPEADTKRDAQRKPAEMVTFAGIKPGDKVLDFMPGSGYFTRVFSRVVGPKGAVYALVPQQMADRRPTAADGVKAIAAEPAYQNVKVLVQPAASFTAPTPLDMVWTSQNYHDMHLESFGMNVAVVNKAVFEALKRGGVYIVLDHSARPGSGLGDTQKLHRIDPAVVKTEVTAAGFVFEGESGVLQNTDDPHTAMVFDPSIRGKTDQFVYKFRKPK